MMLTRQAGQTIFMLFSGFIYIHVSFQKEDIFTYDEWFHFRFYGPFSLNDKECEDAVDEFYTQPVGDSSTMKTQEDRATPYTYRYLSIETYKFARSKDILHKDRALVVYKSIGYGKRVVLPCLYCRSGDRDSRVVRWFRTQRFLRFDDRAVPIEIDPEDDDEPIYTLGPYNQLIIHSLKPGMEGEYFCVVLDLGRIGPDISSLESILAYTSLDSHSRRINDGIDKPLNVQQFIQIYPLTHSVSSLRNSQQPVSNTYNLIYVFIRDVAQVKTVEGNWTECVLDTNGEIVRFRYGSCQYTYKADRNKTSYHSRAGRQAERNTNLLFPIDIVLSGYRDSIECHSTLFRGTFPAYPSHYERERCADLVSPVTLEPTEKMTAPRMTLASIAQVLENVTALIGERLELECKGLSVGGLGVWMRGIRVINKDMVEARQQPGVLKGLQVLAEQDAKRIYVNELMWLIIQNLQEEDYTIYGCWESFQPKVLYSVVRNDADTLAQTRLIQSTAYWIIMSINAVISLAYLCNKWCVEKQDPSIQKDEKANSDLTSSDSEASLGV